MSDDNIVFLDNVTLLDIPTDRVLERAKDHVRENGTVIVIGIDKEGKLYFASSKASGSEVLWWLEKAKRNLLEVGE